MWELRCLESAPHPSVITDIPKASGQGFLVQGLRRGGGEPEATQTGPHWSQDLKSWDNMGQLICKLDNLRL